MTVSCDSLNWWDYWECPTLSAIAPMGCGCVQSSTVLNRKTILKEKGAAFRSFSWVAEGNTCSSTMAYSRDYHLRPKFCPSSIPTSWMMRWVNWKRQPTHYLGGKQLLKLPKSPSLMWWYFLVMRQLEHFFYLFKWFFMQSFSCSFLKKREKNCKSSTWWGWVGRFLESFYVTWV